MNILFLCDEYPPGKHGGIGTVVQLLARELVKQGHTVVVAGFYDWGYGGEDSFDDNGVKVYRYRRLLSSPFFSIQESFLVKAANKILKATGIFQWDIKKSLQGYRKFVEELISRYSIDIIEMPDYNDYLRFCNTKVSFPRFSVPVVVKQHGSITYINSNNGWEVPQHIREGEREILNQAAAVCAVSRYRADKAHEYKEYDGQIDVLYNGVNTEDIDRMEGPDIRKNRVVFTGALSENKGIYKLMDAWNMVCDSVENVQLEVLGKGPVEKVKKHLNPAYETTVTFHGHTNRASLVNVLKGSTVAVFPSLTESFAMGPMEAMACGTAVIYTTRSSGPELITNKVDGLLADPVSAQDIADNICLLLNNSDICQKLAEAGKEKIHTSFSISVVARNHIEYYKKVLRIAAV